MEIRKRLLIRRWAGVTNAGKPRYSGEHPQLDARVKGFIEP